MLISIFYNKEHLSQVMDLNHLLKLLAFNSLNFNLIVIIIEIIVICFPKEHLGILRNSLKRVCEFQIFLEFGNVGYWGEEETGVPGEKPLGAKERTNNKLNPHMASTPGFEPGLHWKEASALTLALPIKFE